MKTSKREAVAFVVLLALITIVLCVSCALVHKYPDLGILIVILSVTWIGVAALVGEYIIIVMKRAKYFEGILDDMVDWQ